MRSLLNRAASAFEEVALSALERVAHPWSRVAEDIASRRYRITLPIGEGQPGMTDIGPIAAARNRMYFRTTVDSVEGDAQLLANHASHYNTRNRFFDPGKHGGHVVKTDVNFGRPWGGLTSRDPTKADWPLHQTVSHRELTEPARKVTNLKLPKPPSVTANPPSGSAPNWTRPGASTPGQWAPDTPKPWDPSQRGQMVHVPRPSSTPPINKVASTNSPIGPSGSVWGAAATGVVGGGLTANFFSSEENRGFGTFVKGGLFGLGGGLGMHMAMGSKIMSGTTGAIARAAKKGGNETAISWAGGAHRAAVMAQSQQSRAAAWSAGALLAGGMGGSGKSKAHGMNANRGNRFGG